MCMFQEKFIKRPTDTVKIGYKAYYVRHFTATPLPIYYQVQDISVGSWITARAGRGFDKDFNPGFNLFSKEKDAADYAIGRASGTYSMVIVRVRAKQVVSRGEDGFCAMKIFISVKDWEEALEKLDRSYLFMFRQARKRANTKKRK